MALRHCGKHCFLLLAIGWSREEKLKLTQKVWCGFKACCYGDSIVIEGYQVTVTREVRLPFSSMLLTSFAI